MSYYAYIQAAVAKMNDYEREFLRSNPMCCQCRTSGTTGFGADVVFYGRERKRYPVCIGCRDALLYPDKDMDLAWRRLEKDRIPQKNMKWTKWDR